MILKKRLFQLMLIINRVKKMLLEPFFVWVKGILMEFVHGFVFRHKWIIDFS